MKIAFLIPDINSPVLGPVISLARMLETEYAVEIVGPDFGYGVCPMYRDAYPLKVVETPRMYRLPDYFWESQKLGRAVTGDLIIAVKAYASTLGVALREKRLRGAKVLAYLDEWDGAVMTMKTRSQRWAAWRRHWLHPLDAVYHPLVERWMPKADGVLSTSSFLQQRFGGDIVHVGVDTDFYGPAPLELVDNLRRDFGLQEKKCIVFGGVARPHKGLDLILDALVTVADPTIRLVIVGPITDLVRAWQANERYAPYLYAAGARPQADMPLYLSLADLFVLPLNDTPLAQSQVPCKIFEAMAMAKPIIASAVSDLPEILDGCGVVVPPGDCHSLAAAIQQVLADEEGAKAMGQAAREKCVRCYSRDVARGKLVGIVTDYVSMSGRNA